MSVSGPLKVSIHKNLISHCTVHAVGRFIYMFLREMLITRCERTVK